MIVKSMRGVLIRSHRNHRNHRNLIDLLEQTCLFFIFSCNSNLDSKLSDLLFHDKIPKFLRTSSASLSFSRNFGIRLWAMIHCAWQNCSRNSRYSLRFFVVAMDMGSSLTDGHRRNKMQKLKSFNCKSNYKFLCFLCFLCDIKQHPPKLLARSSFWLRLKVHWFF